MLGSPEEDRRRIPCEIPDLEEVIDVYSSGEPISLRIPPRGVCSRVRCAERVWQKRDAPHGGVP